MNGDGSTPPRDDDEREADAQVAGLAWHVLASSKWAMTPRRWRDVVVVIEPPAAPCVELRVQLAERLRGAGLDEVAHTVVAMHVPDGSILLWATFDDAQRAEVGLDVVRLVERPTSGRRRH
ncbi:MAG: hypothetical protein ACLQVI_26145 [Polyangiaceae bacterium]